jgi:hypothetical protein
MNRLIKSNSSVSSRSTRILEIPEIINEEHVEYHDEDSFIDVNDWKIPKVPSKEIYRKKWSMTSFKTEQHVKTFEQVYALNKEHELCQLFSPEAIKRYRKEGHNFIHIGLVQVAIKPLTRRGLKASVRPFGLKNVPSEFQNIMNAILIPLSKYSIVYIDDVLIFSKSIEEHWKHLNSFLEVIKVNGLVVSATKIKLFQTNIRFFGYNIHQSKISPISRVIQFADKFPDEILEKTQLQRFLGSLTYVADFYQNFRKKCKPLLIDFKQALLRGLILILPLSKKLSSMSRNCPVFDIPTIDSFKIVETDASDIGYGGILKQQVHSNQPD